MEVSLRGSSIGDGRAAGEGSAWAVRAPTPVKPVRVRNRMITNKVVLIGDVLVIFLTKPCHHEIDDISMTDGWPYWTDRGTKAVKR